MRAGAGKRSSICWFTHCMFTTAEVEARARNSIQVSHVSGRGSTCGSSSIVFPDALADNGNREQMGLKPEPLWDVTRPQHWCWSLRIAANNSCELLSAVNSEHHLKQHRRRYNLLCGGLSRQEARRKYKGIPETEIFLRQCICAMSPRHRHGYAPLETKER